jgi:hypothetical protein
LSFAEALLAHVSDANTIEARGLRAGGVGIADRNCRNNTRMLFRENLGEGEKRCKQNHYSRKWIGTTSEHSHELEIILSRAEIGRHSPGKS